jgi:recombination associated protein RdgC
MGFLTGRVTFTRYRVGGASPLPLSDDILEQARQHLVGRHGSSEPAEGIVAGWAGGDHVLDLSIDLGKNVINDAVHLAIRIDTDKIPGSLLRAYTQIEINARAQGNPSGVATKAQREEAKEAAKQRASAEAADGRFRRHNHYPVLWDGQTQTLYAGTASTSVLERLQGLFRETFDRPLEPITAGNLARGLAHGDPSDADRQFTILGSSPITMPGGPAEASPSVAWSGDDPTSLDYLGNEFLVWIWHVLQNDGETVQLSDGSEATVMLAKTLTLDCPRGETGRDQLTDDAPTRLPEALRALQAGKLPRKAGMIVVRHGAQYELTLQAETLAVSGAAIPKPDDEGLSRHEQRIARIDSLRHLTETLDLLFEAYLLRRTGTGWTDELGRIRRWLQAA